MLGVGPRCPWLMAGAPPALVETRGPRAKHPNNPNRIKHDTRKTASGTKI